MSKLRARKRETCFESQAGNKNYTNAKTISTPTRQNRPNSTQNRTRMPASAALPDSTPRGGTLFILRQFARDEAKNLLRFKTRPCKNPRPALQWSKGFPFPREGKNSTGDLTNGGSFKMG